ncbi:DUF222 domain-containing protein [Rhodococcus hoagii]|nr:DUF222 domain-containing protein [Prescottella equi]
MRAGRNEARHGEFAHVEVAGVLGLTESAARRMIDLGCDLRWRLHQVRAEFRAGRIDLAKAHALSEALSNVSDDKLEDIERRLLDGAGRSTTSRLEERARRLIARLDPDGARERRLRAADDRDVRVIAGDNAMSHLDGLLPAEGAADPPRVRRRARLPVRIRGHRRRPRPRTRRGCNVEADPHAVRSRSGRTGRTGRGLTRRTGARQRPTPSGAEALSADGHGENAKAIAGKNLSAEWPTVRDRPHERWCVPIPELRRGGRHLRPRPHDSVRPRSPRAGRTHHRIESCLPVSDPSPTRDARLLVRPSDR